MIDLNLFRKNIYTNSGVKPCPGYGEDGVLNKIFEDDLDNTFFILPLKNINQVLFKKIHPFDSYRFIVSTSD